MELELGIKSKFVLLDVTPSTILENANNVLERLQRTRQPDGMQELVSPPTRSKPRPLGEVCGYRKFKAYY